MTTQHRRWFFDEFLHFNRVFQSTSYCLSRPERRLYRLTYYMVAFVLPISTVVSVWYNGSITPRVHSGVTKPAHIRLRPPATVWISVLNNCLEWDKFVRLTLTYPTPDSCLTYTYTCISLYYIYYCFFVTLTSWRANFCRAIISCMEDGCQWRTQRKVSGLKPSTLTGDFFRTEIFSTVLYTLRHVKLCVSLCFTIAY